MSTSRHVPPMNTHIRNSNKRKVYFPKDGKLTTTLFVAPKRSTIVWNHKPMSSILHHKTM